MEGFVVNQTFNELYFDLIAMKEDLEHHLATKNLSSYVKQLTEEELLDINSTLGKLESGFYGICEETGELLPEDLLKFQPTVRSITEVKSILQFFKKPVIPIIE